MNKRTPMRHAPLVVMTLALCLTAMLTSRLCYASDDHDHREGEEETEHEEGEGHDQDEEKRRAFSVADFEKAGVRLSVAGPGEVDVGVDLPAEVRPNADRIAHIAPRFPGIVREVRKHIGDPVRAGEVLAIIESENLSSFELRAAFDGNVVDKHVSPGELATREEPAFIVADLSNVWVMVTVYQDTLPLIRAGQPVSIRTSNGKQEAKGTIAYVSPIIDQATRSATARVVLPNPTGRWQPGLFVTATVHEPVTADIVIPRRAVQTFEGKPTVFVAEGDHFEPRAVTLGEVGRTTVGITAGLETGERYADVRSFLVKADLAKGEAEHD